jgi:hypothetical protein
MIGRHSFGRRAARNAYTATSQLFLLGWSSSRIFQAGSGRWSRAWQIMAIAINRSENSDFHLDELGINRVGAPTFAFGLG